MEAKENSFKSIMSDERKLVVPFFQRAYVWEKEKHWIRFFDDLFVSFENKKEHFLGSIILKRSQSSDNFSSIIDGQQRLTTFSILLKVLYDNIDEAKRKHFNHCLFEDYAYDNAPKIKHSKLDRALYSTLFSKEATLDSEVEKGIVGCYNFFNKRLSEIQDKEKVFEFMKFINDSKIWVAVRLNANEDEQKIFDSINSTGEPLNVTDIVKNALFDRTIKEVGENKASEWYGKYWEKIFELDDEHRDFWNSKIGVGRVNRSYSEILLHALAVMEEFFNPDKHRIEELSMLYKEQIRNKNGKELENFLEHIYNTACNYYEIPKFNKETLITYDWKTRFFHIIYMTDTNTALPLILFLIDKLKKDENLLKECFYILEILILCNADTKEYNKFFAKLIRDISKKSISDFSKCIKQEATQKYGECLTDKWINEWLNDISNDDAKLILFWIELYRQDKEKDYKDKTIGLQYVYQLEHLMPQSWQENWADIGKDDDNANRLIYQIGNMTLLKGGLNKALKNKSWNVKLKGDGSARNYIKKNTDLLITRELLDKTQWNETEIKSRTESLIKEFFKIWDINKLND